MHLQRCYVCLGICGLAAAAGIGALQIKKLGDRAEAPAPPQPAHSAPREEEAPRPTRELLLAQSERKFIWEVEHHGHLLGKHGFRPLESALSKADEAALQGLLAPQFQGHVPAEPNEVRAATHFATLSRQESRGTLGPPLTGDEFIARLLEHRKHFAKPPQVR